MKSTLFLFIIGFSLSTAAQTYKSIALESKATTLWVELESLNQLQIKHSKEVGLIQFQFNNHGTYAEPMMIERNGLVAIKVVHNKETLLQSQQDKYRAGQPPYPNYILEIPINYQVKISYKQGNMTANNFTGELELYLDHGIVQLENLSGSATVQSYGGVINCSAYGAHVRIESKEGKVTSDIRDKRLVIGQRSIKGNYGDSQNSLQITTILGKVTLSRPEDQ